MVVSQLVMDRELLWAMTADPMLLWSCLTAMPAVIVSHISNVLLYLSLLSPLPPFSLNLAGQGRMSPT